MNHQHAMASPQEMKDAVIAYRNVLAQKLHTGHAREHAYRTALETLIESIDDGVNAINDPSQSEHGAPDFVFLRGDMKVGYAETKDIGVSLDKTEKTDQLVRYFGYSNLILTDYLEFRFFRNGQRYGEAITIGKQEGDRLVVLPGREVELANAISDFLQGQPEPIKSGRQLAGIMAGKARRIRDDVRRYLKEDGEKNVELTRIYDTIRKLLVHDLTMDKFADMYAQTLVYGMFVARYNDHTPENFTRQEARDLVPASNPFLRDFFDHIAGSRFDKRLADIVDELCSVFSVSDIREIVHRHLYSPSAVKDEKDPIIHFYEDFLKQYDPEERKRMGAYYTPLPVARFIVRAVDEILKRDFGLAKGLGDTSKRRVQVVSQGKKVKTEMHRVQILDPAVGTATFLNEIVNHIHESFAGQQGRWRSYVNDDLLPRLYGFEIMMAPYTIAHLKLGMTLQETGCTELKGRLGVYLTNTLEEVFDIDDTLWAGLGLPQTIAEESVTAGKIKKERPIMVIVGNPPYSVSSSNKGKWIQEQIKVYKEGLGEKKLNLDDDYIKFIRFSEQLVERNGSGIVAMITNSSYIDGVTHRQMRKHLLETFDDVYVFDLHGSTTKQEKSPDGSTDENVFEIQQGVAIAVFVKHESEKKKKLGRLWYAELFGTRKAKFFALDESSLASIKWIRLENRMPYLFFVPKDLMLNEEYERGIRVNNLFNVFGPGVKTERDRIAINFDREGLKKVVEDFRILSEVELRQKYSLSEDSRDWSISRAKNDVQEHYENDKYLSLINYRPFDQRWIYYTGTSKGFVGTPGKKVMSHILRENVGLVLARQFGGKKHLICFIANRLTEISSQPFAPYTLFPLYLYHPDGTRTVNFDRDELKKLTINLKKEYQPEDVLDYIYAVLHSPSYREKYKEFLKIDFPRVPPPASDAQFHRLAAFGKRLRELHLMTTPDVNKFITTYPKDGLNVVEVISYKEGNVWINKDQYFGNVPETAWTFYIGGYQPAQKWLKDRKGRVLTNADIEHYQKIIVVLAETGKIMGEIDEE